MDWVINKRVKFCRTSLSERDSQICLNHSESELYKNLEIHNRHYTRSCWVLFPEPVKYGLYLYFFFFYFRYILVPFPTYTRTTKLENKNIFDTFIFIFPMPSFVHYSYMSYFWNTRRKSYIINHFSPVNCYSSLPDQSIWEEKRNLAQLIIAERIDHMNIYSPQQLA